MDLHINQWPIQTKAVLEFYRLMIRPPALLLFPPASLHGADCRCCITYIPECVIRPKKFLISLAQVDQNSHQITRCQDFPLVNGTRTFHNPEEGNELLSERAQNHCTNHLAGSRGRTKAQRQPDDATRFQAVKMWSQSPCRWTSIFRFMTRTNMELPKGNVWAISGRWNFRLPGWSSNKIWPGPAHSWRYRPPWTRTIQTFALLPRIPCVARARQNPPLRQSQFCQTKARPAKRCSRYRQPGPIEISERTCRGEWREQVVGEYVTSAAMSSQMNERIPRGMIQCSAIFLAGKLPREATDL